MSVPAIVILGSSALKLAERIRAALGEAEIHALAARGPTQEGGTDASFSETIPHLAELFAEGRPIIGVCASGILIRALGTALQGKQVDPPVIAVAKDGSSVVPLLGGHHGANDLARRIAAAIGGHAAVTTASDVKLGVALDQPPPGWRLQDAGAVKAVTARLLVGARARLVNETGANPAWLKPVIDGDDLGILISHRADATADLVYHPASLVIGVGCERLTAPEEVIALVRRCLREANLSERSVACIASIALKAAEPAIHAAAAALGVPARFFSAAALEREAPRLENPSDIVFAETGCHGVAEGAALAGVGAAGTLVVAKSRSARATCAIGRAPGVLDPSRIGRARGRLDIVGIGPGAAAGRTIEVDAALRTATDLVGYKLYLDLLGPLTAGKRLHGYDLGAEEQRVRIALDLAAQGRAVALVCSGDAGIYAMATLVYELIDRGDNTDWARVEIRGLPGVSAMQVAAARIGAPLGHDFCAISLSDLLTPWPAIEQRLKAAAEGDFVIAFYNPVSQRRRTQLAAAKDILLQHRPTETPVILARNLGREGETVTVTKLGKLDIDAVDMLTLVIVGSSETKAVERPDGGVWVYTPRGYAAKTNLEKAS
ncbi:MAG TPA: precorrin-3B C(17)-methyltransferase [Dongiaceae bacterium]|nr:precorrin-3B C(17)-methyltransferase [Dongiaceae bacterium]